jgi:hypothetical protein
LRPERTLEKPATSSVVLSGRFHFKTKPGTMCRANFQPPLRGCDESKF